MSNEVLAVETTEVVEVQNQAMSSEAFSTILANLEKMKTSKGAIQLNGEYFDFAKAGDKSSGVFIGYQTVKFKDPKSSTGYTDEMDAVKWLVEEEDGTKKIKLSAGAALVNEIKKNGIAVGTGIIITFRELGGKNGQTKLFDVAVVAL